MSVQDEIEQARKAAEAKARGIPEWQLDAMRAEPAGFMRDVVADSRRGISQSASMIPDRLRSQETPRAPSGGTVDVRPPPGIDIIDRMCIEQDRRDRAVRAQQEMELAEIERRLDRSNPHKAKTEYDHLKQYDDAVPPAHREKP